MSKRKNNVLVACGKRVSISAKTQVDSSGVLRFVSGSLPRHLVDSGQIDLNRLCVDYQHKKFSLEDYMRFYIGLGYSVSRFYEVFEKAEVVDANRS